MTSNSNAPVTLVAETSESWWTSGLSHDMANILTVVKSRCEMLASLAPAHFAHVEAIMAACRRGTSLLTPTQRRWASLDGPNGRVDVETAITEVATFAAASRRQLEITLDVRPDLSLQIPSPVLFRILQNVVENAAEASAASDRPESQRLEIHADGNKDVVRITVRDYAGGIPPEIEPHVFDAMFSTKVGKGFERRGLGLYIVKSLLGQFQGTIQIQSADGVGTTVYLQFPTHMLATNA